MLMRRVAQDRFPEPAVRSVDSRAAAPADGWGLLQDGAWRPVGLCLAELLALPLERAQEVLAEAGQAEPSPLGLGDSPGAAAFAAPLDEQEVWAAGVTYQRSREGRREESDGAAALYDHVYSADRPELFFKSVAARVVGPGQPVGIRADSSWDVPEPELALVLNSRGEIFGYTVGNDMSSRSIEGENPLYLPQAKMYTAACALGPGIVPVAAAGPGPFGITMRIERDGNTVYAGSTSTGSLVRSLPELSRWLFQAMDFPVGAILLTGTGLVPDRSFTLSEGDRITIEIDGIGVLDNPVALVGRKEIS